MAGSTHNATHTPPYTPHLLALLAVGRGWCGVCGVRATFSLGIFFFNLLFFFFSGHSPGLIGRDRGGLALWLGLTLPPSSGMAALATDGAKWHALVGCVFPNREY
jgi:hypothetical protein